MQLKAALQAQFKRNIFFFTVLNLQEGPQQVHKGSLENLVAKSTTFTKDFFNGHALNYLQVVQIVSNSSNKYLSLFSKYNVTH